MEDIPKPPTKEEWDKMNAADKVEYVSKLDLLHLESLETGMRIGSESVASALKQAYLSGLQTGEIAASIGRKATAEDVKSLEALVKKMEGDDTPPWLNIVLDQL